MHSSKSAQLRKFCAYLAACFLAVFLTACQQEIPVTPVTPEPEDTYVVDPLFAQLYNLLGGKDVLGDVISPVIAIGDVNYQYTVGALMVYEPNAPAEKRFRLAPLGLSMGVAEPPVAQPSDPEVVYVEGHVVYQEFIQIYQRLGETFVGRPITEIRYNAERKRFEQYFEKMGFYRSEEDAPGTVRLLAYGLWECDMLCRSPKVVNGTIDLPKLTQAPLNESDPCYEVHSKMVQSEGSSQAMDLEEQECFISYLPYLSQKLLNTSAFTSATEYLPPSFVGRKITEPFLASDGNLEQIFENVVIYASPTAPDELRLRSITEKVGIATGVMEADNQDPMMAFYAFQGDLGYNVPRYFLHYLELYGGLAIAGDPITPVRQIDATTFQQCFQNLCVEEKRDTEDGLLIHLAPLGNTYKQLMYPSMGHVAREIEAEREITIQVWSRMATVAPDQEQEVGAAIAENGEPILDIEPVLMLTLPDGTQQPYTMPPTGNDGQTSLSLPAIPASNGTIIPYQVCIFTKGGEKLCVKDSYLIWTNQ